jgi:hypothetical protein
MADEIEHLSRAESKFCTPKADLAQARQSACYRQGSFSTLGEWSRSIYDGRCGSIGPIHETFREYVRIVGAKYLAAIRAQAKQFSTPDSMASIMSIARDVRTTAGQDSNSLRLVTCHLGNGCSLAAIREGHSIDTTMGTFPNKQAEHPIACSEPIIDGDLDGMSHAASDGKSPIVLCW